MILSDGATLLHTALAAVMAYAALVAIVRLSGKRLLSKWNAFDLVVTVALGSSLATIILTGSVSWSQGAVALGTLALLQYAVTWMSVRVEAFERAVKSSPALLLHRGVADEEALRRERVTLAELAAAVRAGGLARLEDAGAAILETDGSISVIADLGEDEPTALHGVRGYAPGR